MMGKESIDNIIVDIEENTIENKKNALSEFKNSQILIPVVEIFNSISGEGISAGRVVTFLRVAGCNLRCSYCDTQYSYEESGKDIEMLKPSEILKKVSEYNCREVLCTGGEPLEVDKPKRYIPLYLASKGYNVRIETNGSQPLYSEEEIMDFGLDDLGRLSYSVDVKCPSSNMVLNMCIDPNSCIDENKSASMGMNIDKGNDALIINNFSKLKNGDELKFIVGNQEDLSYSIQIINKYKEILAVNDVIINYSPVFGKMKPERIVEFLKEKNRFFEENGLVARLSLQIHKIIWEPDERGV